MRVGDMVKLHSSRRRNGKHAGKIGLIVDVDAWENPTVNIDNEVKSFHYTQIEEVFGRTEWEPRQMGIDESR